MTALPADASGADIGEGMARWLDAFEAIRLQAALQSLRALTMDGPVARAGTAEQLEASLTADVQRTRSALAKAIARDPLMDSAANGYTAYRRRHLELQRQMQMMVTPLREHVRTAVARVSPALRQLAILDELLAQVIFAREQSLWPAAANLLERGFDSAARTLPPDDLRALRVPGSWLERFEADWRRALTAEVDLRLAPVVGLIEALRDPTNSSFS